MPRSVIITHHSLFYHMFDVSIVFVWSQQRLAIIHNIRNEQDPRAPNFLLSVLLDKVQTKILSSTSMSQNLS